MADATPKSYHTDPQLYLYTSLTSGSSYIITATSRLETILKANKVSFQALDVATDEKARMLWGRRAGKRKLPGLVRMGMVVGDLDEIEEWNEYGELKHNIGTLAPAPPRSSSSDTPSKSTPRAESSTPTTNPEHPLTATMRQAGTEAAQKASDAKSKACTTPSAAERSEASTLTLKSLDNSGPTGMPPPSGTTDAESAQAPETGKSSVQGKADTVPMTSESAAESTSSLHAGLPGRPHEGRERTVTQHRGCNVEVVTKEKAAELERKALIREEDEDEEAVEGFKARERIGDEGKTREATTVTNEAVDLPGKKTQEQEAASAEDAEASVAD